MFKSAVKILSSFFYIGYLPLIPGTFGSLAGIGIFYISRLSGLNYPFVTLLVIIIGFMVCGKAEKAMGKSDPRQVVIDEVSGMLLSMLFVPYDIKLVFVAFILFRVLDTMKPYPACRIEKLKGSIGIMGDDLVAGLYTNIILQVVVRLVSFKAS